MSLVLLAPDRDMQSWEKALLDVDPNLEIEIWPDVKEKAKVHFVVAWNHPKHVLDSYPNLQAVSSLGAGADHLLNDEYLPEEIPICRVVSPSLVRQMKEYVLCAVLNYQRNTNLYALQKQEGVWESHPSKSPEDFTVGIMGLGELGLPTATHLASLGYQVHGWSKSAKDIEAVATYFGQDEFEKFLSESRVLVCMLPLTEETEGILNLEAFKMMNKPGYLINVARGEHLVDEDLVYALDKEWLEGATLDVFAEEPLPNRHSFWNRDKIMITPHVSSVTPPGEAARQIVDNYKRALSGMALEHQVDRERGY